MAVQTIGEAKAARSPTSPTLIALRGDEEDLYARHHRALQRVVGRRVDLSPDLIEDACQQTWIKLLRFQPDRGPKLFGWLVIVAVREAYRLSDNDRQHISLDAPATTSEDRTSNLASSLVSPANIDDSLEARRALRALAALPPRQRRYEALRVAGVSYTEIAAAEQVTFTNVNRHLSKASGNLRQAAAQAA